MCLPSCSEFLSVSLSLSLSVSICLSLSLSVCLCLSGSLSLSLSVSLCLYVYLSPLGTEAGPPGPPGVSAAPAVASGTRCASAPATTPHPGMGGVSVWDKAETRGETEGLNAVHTVRFTFSQVHIQAGFLVALQETLVQRGNALKW